jgi:hypothetical protein
LFVLDTYHNFHNRVKNHAILATTFAANMVVLLSLSLVAIKSLFWAACMLKLAAPAPVHGKLLLFAGNTLAQVRQDRLFFSQAV